MVKYQKRKYFPQNYVVPYEFFMTSHTDDVTSSYIYSISTKDFSKTLTIEEQQAVARKEKAEEKSLSLSISFYKYI